MRFKITRTMYGVSDYYNGEDWINKFTWITCTWEELGLILCNGNEASEMKYTVEIKL